ncbi:MAG TPA: flagellar basal body-associated FliL family protein [Vicinamibacterales bacterium]|nr:flagellar basal body-associated FliL family protein [Vicinamibacterales bacterium]
MLVVLAAAAFTLLWQRSAPAHAADEVAHVAAGIVPLEPFLVNLADPNARRFARVTVRLLVGTAEEAEAIAADPVRQSRLRSATLEILAQETAGGLVTPDGKAELKKAIGERGSSVLGLRVHDVLFTDFVVQ